MPRKSGKTPRGGASHDQIVSAALRVLDDPAQSFDARTVAKEAGKSLGTLSFHFRDGGLRQLRGEVAQHGFEQLVGELESAATIGQGPLDAIRGLGHAYVRFAVDRPRLHRLMHGEPWGAAVEPYRSDAQSLLRDYIVTGQDAGVVRAGSPGGLARVAWAVMHGVSVLYLDGHVEAAELNEVVDESIDVLLQGLSR